MGLNREIPREDNSPVERRGSFTAGNANSIQPVGAEVVAFGPATRVPQVISHEVRSFPQAPSIAERLGPSSGVGESTTSTASMMPMSGHLPQGSIIGDYWETDPRTGEKHLLRNAYATPGNGNGSDGPTVAHELVKGNVDGPLMSNIFVPGSVDSDGKPLKGVPVTLSTGQRVLINPLVTFDLEKPDIPDDDADTKRTSDMAGEERQQETSVAHNTSTTDVRVGVPHPDRENEQSDILPKLYGEPGVTVTSEHIEAPKGYAITETEKARAQAGIKEYTAVVESNPEAIRELLTIDGDEDVQSIQAMFMGIKPASLVHFPIENASLPERFHTVGSYVYDEVLVADTIDAHPDIFPDFPSDGNVAEYMEGFLVQNPAWADDSQAKEKIGLLLGYPKEAVQDYAQYGEGYADALGTIEDWANDIKVGVSTFTPDEEEIVLHISRTDREGNYHGATEPDYVSDYIEANTDAVRNFLESRQNILELDDEATTRFLSVKTVIIPGFTYYDGANTVDSTAFPEKVKTLFDASVINDSPGTTSTAEMPRGGLPPGAQTGDYWETDPRTGERTLMRVSYAAPIDGNGGDMFDGSLDGSVAHRLRYEELLPQEPHTEKGRRGVERRDVPAVRETAEEAVQRTEATREAAEDRLSTARARERRIDHEHTKAREEVSAAFRALEIARAGEAGAMGRLAAETRITEQMPSRDNPSGEGEQRPDHEQGKRSVPMVIRGSSVHVGVTDSEMHDRPLVSIEDIRLQPQQRQILDLLRERPMTDHEIGEAITEEGKSYKTSAGVRGMSAISSTRGFLERVNASDRIAQQPDGRFTVQESAQVEPTPEGRPLLPNEREELLAGRTGIERQTLLLISAGKPVETIVATIWPDRSPGDAVNILHTNVSRLRADLEQSGAIISGTIHMDGTGTLNLRARVTHNAFGTSDRETIEKEDLSAEETQMPDERS